MRLPKTYAFASFQAELGSANKALCRLLSAWRRELPERSLGTEAQWRAETLITVLQDLINALMGINGRHPIYPQIVPRVQRAEQSLREWLLRGAQYRQSVRQEERLRRHDS